MFDATSGTGAREALPEPLRSRFAQDCKARLRQAYPPTPHGVVLWFRRIFAVARPSS